MCCCVRGERQVEEIVKRLLDSGNAILLVLLNLRSRRAFVASRTGLAKASCDKAMNGES